MRAISCIFLGFSMFFPPAHAFSEVDLQAQLRQLVVWWPGEYDNNEQIVRQSGGGLAKPVYEPIRRVYTHASLLDLPDIGDSLVYVEQYLNNDPDDVARVRVYSLRIDLQAQAIRAAPHVFRDAERRIVGVAGSEGLAEIEADDLRALPAGCDLLIRFEGSQFRGRSNPATCADHDRFDREFVIGEKHYWFRNLQEGGRDDLPPFVEGTKARRFVCSVAYNLEGDMTRTEPLTEIELHDQGGAADIDWPDGRTLEFYKKRYRIYFQKRYRGKGTGFIFREKVGKRYRIYFSGKGGEKVPGLSSENKPGTFCRHKISPAPFAYAYAVDDADRFGLNLGWFYILCREKDQGAPEA